jgi:hypothetical protein
MTTYEIGTTVPLRFTVLNGEGVPTDADDAVLTITKPDGAQPTLGSPIVDNGVYDFDFTEATIPGRYSARFASINPTVVVTDTFDVWPADPRFIISLADLRDELNVPAGVTVNDDELRLYIAATTWVVESIVGKVLPETVTETFDGGKTAVLLSERASEITSVTVGGVATTSYVANFDAGIVYAGSTSSPTSFTYGRQNVVVTYVTGSTSVDPNVILAARIIAAHQYQVGQQGRTGRGRAIDETTILGSGYAVPTRALQMLEPSMARRMPGFA